MKIGISLVALLISASCVAACSAPNSADKPADESVGQAEQAVQTFHYRWDGGQAYASSYDEYGSTFIDVFENGTGNSREAYLQYSRYSVDPTSYQCQTYYWDWDGDGIPDWSWDYCYYTRTTYEYAWGQIPTSGVHINGSDARVKGTFAASATFYAQRCTYDQLNPAGYVCNDIASFDVDLGWHKDGLYSTFNNGVSEQTYQDVTFRSNGVSHSSSASVTGTVLGHDVTGAYASIGSAKSSYKEVVKNPH